jgi:ribonuclease P protein component
VSVSSPSARTRSSPAIPKPDPHAEGGPDPGLPPESRPPPPARLRLPRRRILRGRPVFDAAFQSGRRTSSRSLTLLVLPPAAAPVPPGRVPTGEVAFLTPKRLGDAVLRNRLRRRLREAYRVHLTPALAPGENRRLIWLAKAPATALDFGGLVAQMKDLYARSLRPH